MYIYCTFFFQLFDFDIEVRPILEVLVGKTVEQALLEVMEEEELANLRMQQREFEELRNSELVEQQRLEEQERRHREEKVIAIHLYSYLSILNAAYRVCLLCCVLGIHSVFILSTQNFTRALACT
jgi:hypothetical protein